MHLPKDHVLLLTVNSAPGTDPPLQCAPNARRQLGVASQHLVEDRHRAQSRRFLQKRHDLSLENMFQRIGSSPLSRLRRLRRKARILCNPIAGGTADVRLGGGNLNGVVLSELHEKPHLLIGYVAARHKGVSLTENHQSNGPTAITDA
jgi:hypothetical protein